MNNPEPLPIKGTLYGVSLGPGDPNLITRGAWQRLQTNAMWTYPIRKKGDESYALNIVLRSGMNLPERHEPLVFPMTHDAEILEKYWRAAAQTVLNELIAGRDVNYLVEGDASTYSTFGYLAKTLRALDPNANIVTIAGVSSYHAAAARVQMPLTENDDAMAVIPAAYGIGIIDKMLDEFDTLVLLKVKPLLDDVLSLLERRGLLDHARFIEKAGAPEERVVEVIAELRGTKVNYLSLMIVRNPNRQRGELVRGCRKKTQLLDEVSV